MPIHLPLPPAPGRELLAKHGFGTVSRGRFAAAADSTPQSVTRPHRVYTIGRDALLRDELLSAARPVAWRYLLVTQDAAISAAELNVTGDGELVFSEVNEGPFVQATIETLSAAEALDEVQRGDFELRLLKIPAVYVVALWLHSDTSDLIVPMTPVPAGVSSGHVYSPTDLLEALRPLALRSPNEERG